MSSTFVRSVLDVSEMSDIELCDVVHFAIICSVLFRVIFFGRFFGVVKSMTEDDDPDES